MKKIMLLVVAVIAITFAGCAVNSSSNVDFEGEDVTYIQDSRTGLCFAVAASRQSFHFSTSGLGLTMVPCSAEVVKLIK